jgi:hypothetical protein
MNTQGYCIKTKHNNKKGTVKNTYFWCRMLYPPICSYINLFFKLQPKMQLFDVNLQEQNLKKIYISEY